MAAIGCQHLERTERSIWLTVPLTEGEQTDAVTVPLPCCDTKLYPVHALELWLRAVGIIIFRPQKFRVCTNCTRR